MLSIGSDRSMRADTISAVIPSRNRPQLVGVAVRSALRQTLGVSDVVVVIDGPDFETEKELAQIADDRLKVVALEERVGAQEARNVGVREARGEWIAFLDDDDEWLPEKLERQMEAAKASRWSSPIVTCRMIVRTADGEVVWPARGPAPDESVGDYLLLRRLSELGDIRLQTSSLMTTKELLTRVPWKSGMHDDWDLVLRASAIEGVGLAFAPEPLVIWNADVGRERLSLGPRPSWRKSANWLRSVRPLVGPRASANFLLSTLSQWARRQRDWAAFFEIPVQAIRMGRPTPTELLAHVARWTLPRRLRRLVKRPALKRMGKTTRP